MKAERKSKAAGVPLLTSVYEYSRRTGKTFCVDLGLGGMGPVAVEFEDAGPSVEDRLRRAEEKRLRKMRRRLDTLRR